MKTEIKLSKERALIIIEMLGALNNYLDEGREKDNVRAIINLLYSELRGKTK